MTSARRCLPLSAGRYTPIVSHVALSSPTLAIISLSSMGCCYTPLLSRSAQRPRLDIRSPF